MPKWEYKLLNAHDAPSEGLFKGRSREGVEAYLNTLGAEGWEIVSIDFFDQMPGETGFLALAKREVP